MGSQKSSERAFGILQFPQPPGTGVRFSEASDSLSLEDPVVARSNADFIAKMGIVEEELDESLCWLDLLLATGQAVSANEAKRLSGEADELLAMTIQSIRTARGGSR